jgi:hypothetical protein
MRIMPNLRQQLHESYLLTQHPYRCPKCRSHRTFLNPHVNKIPVCPECHVPLTEDIPVKTSNYLQMGPYRQEYSESDHYFLHTYTPLQAITIIDTIPDDSFHWPAVMWGKVEEYAEQLSEGRWTTIGQYWHPIRFNGSGILLTGAQRVLACFLANLPMPNWTVDHSQLWFKDDIWVHPT